MSELRLYHRKPREMWGETLHPLNALKNLAPQVYEAQRAKYDGREMIMGQRVPMLNCLWNDVLHFSPVHPGKIAALAREMGLEWYEAQWFEIDPVAMGFDPSNTVVFRYADIELEDVIPIEEFERFDPVKLTGMTNPPAATREYYRKIGGGPRYFIFAGVPHVLHRGPLDVAAMGTVVA